MSAVKLPQRRSLLAHQGGPLLCVTGLTALVAGISARDLSRAAPPEVGEAPRGGFRLTKVIPLRARFKGEVQPFEAGSVPRIQSMKWSPSGRWLAVTATHVMATREGDKCALEIYDCRTWRVEKVIPSIFRLTGFSRDGRLLLAERQDRGLELLDTRSWRAVWRLGGRLSESDFRERSALSPDGTRVAAVLGDRTPHGIAVWSISANRLLHRFREGTHVYGFTSDGRFLCAGEGHRVALAWAWDLRSFRTYMGRTAQSRSILSCEVMRAAPRVVTAHGDGSPRIWTIPDWTLVRTLEDARIPQHRIRLSPDGKFVSDDGAVPLIWSTETGRIVQRLPRNLSGGATAFSPDSTHLAVAAGPSIKILERASNVGADAARRAGAGGAYRAATQPSLGK
jgi:WD40 repeat protein